MSTKTDCMCEWDEDDNVISFCGAHMELHRKMLGDIAKTGVRCMEQRNDALAEITRLKKCVTDAGWEAEARREQDEINRASEWR